jgi:hypothetical protein
MSGNGCHAIIKTDSNYITFEESFAIFFSKSKNLVAM